MGRFDELYTEPQRQAVGRAMLDPDPVTGKKVTAPQAVERLNAGTLGVDPPPRPMPTTTAYWCRDREKQRRQGHDLTPAAKEALEDPAAVERKLNQRLVSIHERNIEELEKQRAKGMPDSRLMGMVIKNHRELMAAIRPIPSARAKAKKVPPKTPQPTDPVVENDVQRLQRAHEQSGRGTNGTPVAVGNGMGGAA
jgi:hypothetical protein